MRSSSYVNSLAKGCFLISLGVFLWVAYSVAGRFIPGLPGLEGAAPVIQADPQKTNRKKIAANYNINRIVGAHLFGEVDKKKDIVDATTAPETKLQLSLAGLMSSRNEEFARAMIAVNRGEVRSYRVGQQIEGTDAILHAIQPADVLLDRSGNLERLPMKRELLASLSEDAKGDGSRAGPTVLRETNRATDPNLKKGGAFPF